MEAIQILDILFSGIFVIFGLGALVWCVSEWRQNKKRKQPGR